MRAITPGSSMLATIFSRAPQRAQLSISMPCDGFHDQLSGRQISKSNGKTLSVRVEVARLSTGLRSYPAQRAIIGRAR
jgi:hypothetical protein